MQSYRLLAVLCAYAAKLHVSNVHLARRPEEGAYVHPPRGNDFPPVKSV